jgi:hypothetical protein
MAPPVLDRCQPQRGPTVGGTVLDIEGSNLTGTTEVVFFGTLAAEIIQVADSTVRVRTPAAASLPATIKVTTPEGSASLDSAFTYEAAYYPEPEVSDRPIAPDPHGSVILHGEHFSYVTDVSVDGADVPFAVEADTRLSVILPPGRAEPLAVILGYPRGSGVKTFAPAYTAVCPPPEPPNTALPPLIYRMDPASGRSWTNQPGPDTIVFGEHLSRVTSMRLQAPGRSEEEQEDLLSALTFRVLSDQHLRVTFTGNQSQGTWLVTARSPYGIAGVDYYASQLIPVGPQAYTLSPNHGPAAGGNEVTITSSFINDSGTVAVLFGGTNPSPNARRVGTTSVVCVVPPGPPGPVEVTVLTAGGYRALPNGYTYEA